MRHPVSQAPEALSAINGAAPEIQPHQHLIRAFHPPSRAREGPESVDAARRALYKTGNGGGRNPAAAVLWAAPSGEQSMLREWHSQEHPEIYSVDHNG
jgi:hypothetical protein